MRAPAAIIQHSFMPSVPREFCHSKRLRCGVSAHSSTGTLLLPPAPNCGRKREWRQANKSMMGKPPRNAKQQLCLAYLSICLIYLMMFCQSACESKLQVECRRRACLPQSSTAMPLAERTTQSAEIERQANSNTSLAACMRVS